MTSLLFKEERKKEYEVRWLGGEVGRIWAEGEKVDGNHNYNI